MTIHSQITVIQNYICYIGLTYIRMQPNPSRINIIHRMPGASSIYYSSAVIEG
ncbi:Uncharacterised protein [Escherichia coli]|nr:Uncharacterised protein [Escherichia coli]